jgi:glutaredoxin
MRRYYFAKNFIKNHLDAVCGFLAVFGLLLSLCPVQACADIYQWTDATGSIHFSDKKPADRPAEQMNPRVNSFAGIVVEPPPPTSTEKPKTAPKKVVMYSTQRCGYCKQARAYFKKAGIAYRDYDIDESESARREYDRVGGRGVPLIFIGKTRMTGFSEERFKSIYQK